MEKRLTKEEFLKDLWHPANEIPKEFNHYGFAALYILQYNHQIRMVLYDKDNMSWKNVISNNEYWLYVDDLLPKEGGEQRLNGTLQKKLQTTKNGFLQNGMMETMEVLSTKLIIFIVLFIGKIM